MISFDDLIVRAKTQRKSIVFPESGDVRILRAATRLAADKILEPILPGDSASIKKAAKDHGCDLADVRIFDPHKNSDHYAQRLFERRQHKGITLEQAREQLGDPLVLANLMVQCGDADGCVAGAQYATPEVVRTALQVVGKHPDYALVSSFFIMLFEQPFHPFKEPMLFADCGLVVDPDAEQLGHIAAATADSAQVLLGIEPRVAMLSFSTQGSARHENVDKVSAATNTAKALRPAYDIFGEVQLDAAIVPEILAKKAPGLASKKVANVLIFPDLNAGNIGYKLVHRFAQAEAIGPILQGLNKPVNDLSRGCSEDDVYRAAVITALQASDPSLPEASL